MPVNLTAGLTLAVLKRRERKRRNIRLCCWHSGFSKRQISKSAYQCRSVMASKMYVTPQFFLYQFVTTLNRFKTCLFFVGTFFSLLIYSNNRFYFMTLFFSHFISFHLPPCGTAGSSLRPLQSQQDQLLQLEPQESQQVRPAQVRPSQNHKPGADV